MYGTPESPTDPVNGAKLYENLLAYEKNYYLSDNEADIFQNQSKKLASIIGPNATVVEIGPGSLNSIRKKTIPFLIALPSLKKYIAVDISNYFLDLCLKEIRSTLPNLSVDGLCLNFTDMDSFPRGMSKTVLLFTGSTMANMHTKECENFLVEVQKYISSRGFFVVGQDTNQDRKSLIAAYQNNLVEKFALNLMYRLRRDLSIDGFLPEAFYYEIEWIPNAHEIRHLVVADKDQIIQIGGQIFEIEVGQKYHFSSSYKYSENKFLSMALSANLTSIETFFDHERKMALFVLVS